MKNICVLPFNSVSIDALGNLRGCCSSSSKGFDIYVQDCDTETLFNNKNIIEIRKNFLENKRPDYCERCWKLEDVGNSSFRHYSNNNRDYGLLNNKVINFVEQIDYKNIQYLDITLGNKCNLACRMCNPNSSSLVAKQLNLISGNKAQTELIDFNRTTKDKILTLIERASNLNSIYMLGGEPLINEFHDEIVNLLVETGRSKNITLHYSSNLQIDVEKYLDMCTKFNFVELSASIDGTGSTYEYIRWPGSWNKLCKNLKKIVEFKNNQKRELLFPNIATTVQNLNAHNLPSLIEEIQEIDPDLSFYFIPITGGNHLEIVPDYVLKDSINKLKKFRDKDGMITQLVNFYFDALIKNKNLNKSKIEDFFKTQQSFDNLRNQNLFTTMPHFNSLASDFKINTW